MFTISSEVLDALRFAADQHQYQRRGGYEPLPYINHLIKVTETLLHVGQETERDILVAAVLHDVVEDTAVTVEELAERFGEKVAHTVGELTDDMDLSYDERKRRQVEGAASLSTDARKIRIVDKASNIRDIFSYPVEWSRAKKEAYVENAQAIVAQIRGDNPQIDAYFDEAMRFARQKLQSF